MSYLTSRWHCRVWYRGLAARDAGQPLTANPYPWSTGALGRAGAAVRGYCNAWIAGWMSRGKP